MFKVVDGRAMRTKVEVGQRRDGKVEIVEGISGSDTIVVAGWQRLRDGGAVRPASGGSPAAGGGDVAKAGQAPKPGAATPASSAAPATEKKS